jgi:hypothetical protein
MKMKNKKKNRPKDLVLTNIIKDTKCPVCKEIKEKVIHFIHKDIRRNKRILELFLCEDCCISHKNEIIKNNDKKYIQFVPILNSMLKATGKFEEKTIDQIQEEMEIKVE